MEPSKFGQFVLLAGNVLRTMLKCVRHNCSCIILLHYVICNRIPSWKTMHHISLFVWCVSDIEIVLFRKCETQCLSKLNIFQFVLFPLLMFDCLVILIGYARFNWTARTYVACRSDWGTTFYSSSSVCMIPVIVLFTTLWLDTTDFLHIFQTNPNPHGWSKLIF